MVAAVAGSVGDVRNASAKQADGGGTTEADGSPIDWSVVASTGRLLASSGPSVSQEEAQSCVRELRELSAVAEGHVRDVTGLGAGLPLLQGEVVDRPGWVAAASAGMAELTAGALPSADRPRIGQLLAGSAGVQVGMVFAFLSARVLGQYDPFGSSGGRLLLVAPNVLAAERALGVPPSEFRLWVCLHESTHRLQFSAVPWLRDYFARQVTELTRSMDDLSSRGGPVELARAVRERLRAEDRPTGSIGVVELFQLFQSPEQQATLDRLLALSTLLEGHADHVMDAVGPGVVPSVDVIRQRFTERRKGGGLLDRALRVLLGLDAKIRQYAEGAAFTRHVVGAIGMEGFNAVWREPETLPSRAEIVDPARWLARVHG